jgi:hypothetical protein
VTECTIQATQAHQPPTYSPSSYDQQHHFHRGDKVHDHGRKGFLTKTPMARYKYMHLKLSGIPANVIEHNNLYKIATPDGYMYCEIQKGMYGLPQAGIIAQELLTDQLKLHGYSQSKTTPGLWKHNSHPIDFSLVIDEFGVNYIGKENAQHLLDTIQKYYRCLCDWDREQYCGLTITWDYDRCKVHLLMPTYVQKALQCFQHPPPRIQQKQPHSHVKKKYSVKEQFAKPINETPTLDKARKKFIQEVTGVFFIFLHKQLMEQCSPPSVPLHPNKPPQQKQS